MSTSKQVMYYKEAPEVFNHLALTQDKIHESGLDRRLSHLVMLRASQINGCAFCVDMHTREAREDGETNERLDRLIVWRHSKVFSDEEKAALSWTEALTIINGSSTYEDQREGLREHYSEKEISALTALIGMINLWNRVQISNY